MFFPISLFLNITFGHRTFTHSLLFAFLSGAILYPFTESWVWLATFVGILAHIGGDMLTGKVKFFYLLKQSVGIRIKPFYFTPIDRVTRLILIVAFVFIAMDIIPNIL